ncbi:MAG: hypothetical protein ABEN55_02340 [Bradymonadaceae bacterium]
MFLITITLALILVGFAAFVYGTVALSKYAFRVSTGRGIAALLFPPYTLYFAFSELEEEDKDIPAASWVFGFLVTTLLVAVFSTPLTHLANGRWSQLQATSPGEQATEAYGDRENSEDEGSDDESAATDNGDESDGDSGDESGESSDDGAAEEGGDKKEGDEKAGDKEDKAEEKKGENKESADKEQSGDESGE